MTPENPQGGPQGPVVGYCRACGKALDEANVHRAYGTIYCKEHVPAEPSPYTAPVYNPAPPPIPDASASPALAFLLGFIPGVGAIYNRQYAKGLVHVIIVGLAISILSGSGDSDGFLPLLVMLLIAFWIYMPFEAYHTAKNRREGLPADQFSSLVPAPGWGFPAAPVILIALGTVLLLDNLGLLDLRRTLRYWPVLLIAAGVYLLMARLSMPPNGRRNVDSMHSNDTGPGGTAQ